MEVCKRSFKSLHLYSRDYTNFKEVNFFTSCMTTCPKFCYVTFIKKIRKCESLSPIVVLLKQKHSIPKRYVNNKGHIYNFIVRFMYLNIIKF
jgi:hypothetical protein